MALVHHEQCFGCGRTNLFGILLELEPAGEDSVAGRCFIKQDHQGAVRGYAHDGIIAAALSEAMALCCGPEAGLSAVEVSFAGRAPVGAFVEVSARVEDRCQGSVDPSAEDRRRSAVDASAEATAEGHRVASARGTCERRDA